MGRTSPLRRKRGAAWLLLIGGAVLFTAVHGWAQETQPLPYQTPPPAIAELFEAPPTPDVDVSPTRTHMLILERPDRPPIEELAQPELRLAGLRINPQTHGRSRRSYYTALKIQALPDGQVRAVSGLPEAPRIQNIGWSPDGRYIAFINAENDGQTLWVVEVAEAAARRLFDGKINSVYGAPYHWLSDSRTLICKIVPEDRGDPPPEPTVPVGPVVQATHGAKAPARTYQDLLENPHDEALFAYYMQAQVVRVNLDGESTLLGEPDMFSTVKPSPDGQHLLVETIHRPFSYLVPVYRFPYTVEIWNMQGNVVQQVADLPLAEQVPIGFGAVPTGPRSFNWRADAPATLYWAEAQDGGDPRREADIRDKVYVLPAPFSGEPRELIALELRYGGVRWGDDDLALVRTWWWRDRRERTWIVKPGDPGAAPVVLFDRSWEDRYTDPGDPMMRTNDRGQRVLLTDQKGERLYLRSVGASPEGNRPFVDELNVNTRETRRLWRSEAPYYEWPVAILDTEAFTLLTRRESVDEPPNYFVRNIPQEDLAQVTDFPHPTPQLKDVHKELIRYQREDGVQLTATLYLPPGYDPQDGALPMLMWAYPREYKSADAAGQVTDSPYRFVRVGWWSPLPWLVMGYAVLDDPSMPIVGEGDEEPNDTYVEQLVSSARAAVDEVVRRGVAERGRIAIGGHSYGAFMTANLLAHSDLFAAGIARSGAYNRTLTPFGFQAEERTLWEAPEVYFRMSPFMHADQVNEPILLIHGEADNNSGTYPMQSERFFNALKGLGATARLVMLPLESHGYRAEESIMHMLWEMTNWLEKYVKETPAAPEAVTDKSDSP